MNQREEVAGAPNDLKRRLEKHTHHHVEPEVVRQVLVLDHEHVAQVAVQHEEPARPSVDSSGDEVDHVSDGVVLF